MRPVVEDDATVPSIPLVTATAVTLVSTSLQRSTPGNTKLYVICVESVTKCSIGGRVNPPTIAVTLYMSTHSLPYSGALMYIASDESLSGLTVIAGAEAVPVQNCHSRVGNMHYYAHKRINFMPRVTEIKMYIGIYIIN